MSFYSVKYACRFLLISFILSERAEKRKICPNAAGERRSIFRGQTGSKGGRKRQNKKVCTMSQTKRQPCRHEQKKRADEAKGKTAGRSDGENLCRLRRGKSPLLYAEGRAEFPPPALRLLAPFPQGARLAGKGQSFALPAQRRAGCSLQTALPLRFYRDGLLFFIYIFIYNCRAGA